MAYGNRTVWRTLRERQRRVEHDLLGVVALGTHASWFSHIGVAALLLLYLRCHGTTAPFGVAELQIPCRRLLAALGTQA